MTSTTSETTPTDLGNGWTRHGNRFVWIGEPIGAEDDDFRDALILGYLRKAGGDKAILRIEGGFAAGPLAQALGEVLDGLDWSVDLPVASLPDFAYVLARVLCAHGLWDGLAERIHTEQMAELDKLIQAVGGRKDATLGEAMEALEEQDKS